MESAHAQRRYAARLQTMRKRAEFQRLRGGTRWSGTAFLLEGKCRVSLPTDGGSSKLRFGFTITKKIGLAHERNRMRRRLSHALRLVALPPTLAGWDCVIVARRAALVLPFDALVNDFSTALARLARVPATGRPQAARTKAPPQTNVLPKAEP